MQRSDFDRHAAWMAAGGLALYGLLACSAAHAPAAGSADRADPPDPRPSADPAPAAAPLLALQLDDRVLLFGMDGSMVRALPPFDQPNQDPTAHTRFELHAVGDYALLTRIEQREVIVDRHALRQGVQDTMLLRWPSTEVVWQHRSPLLGLYRGAGAQLDRSGQVVLSEPRWDELESRTLVIAPDGEEHELLVGQALSAPDADGYLAMLVPPSEPTSASAYGFARAGEGFRALREPRLPPRDADEVPAAPIVGDGAAFHYLTQQGGELLLVHETPSAAQRIALGVPPPGLGLELVRGESVFVVKGNDRELSDERPLFVIGREDAQPRALAVPEASNRHVRHAGNDWFVVQAPELSGRVHAVSGEWRNDPAIPKDLRPFDTETCSSTRLLTSEGRTLMALRDDHAAQVYLEDDAGGLQPLGRPIYGAVYVALTRHGATTVVHAVHPSERYCTAAHWAEPQPAGDVLLPGETELVLGANSLVVRERSAAIVVHPQGRFAVVRGTAQQLLHDLAQGSAAPLPLGAVVIGWL